jgi:hypothetical protein
MLHKEEFPFAVFALAFCFIFFINRKVGFYLLVSSVLFLLFNFFLRPLWLGDTYPHGQGLIGQLWSSPFSSLLSIWNGLNFSLLKSYGLSLIIFIFVHIKNSKLSHHIPKESNFDLLLFIQSISFLSPLLLIRMLAKAYDFHYGAPLVAFIFGILSAYPDRFLQFFQKKYILIFVLIISFLNISSSLKKVSSLLFSDRHPKCIISKEKNQITQLLISKIKNVSGHMIATGGIVPQLVFHTHHLSHYGGLSLPRKFYDFIILERHQSGDTWPMSAQDIELSIIRCRPYVHHLWFDDKYFFVAQGLFPHDCLFPSKNH